MKWKNPFKRFLALLMAAMMVISMLPGVAVAAECDISGHWGEETLKKWSDLGWLEGNSLGQYRPDGEITRAEFMALVNRMKGYAGAYAGMEAYADLSEDTWYYPVVSAALEAGYIVGTGEMTASPAATITRQEVMVIIARMAELPDGETAALSSIRDANEVADWAKACVAACIGEGLVAGADGRIAPTANITRAEAVVLLDRIYTNVRSYSFAGQYGGEGEPGVVAAANVSGPGVQLRGKTVTGDLMITPEVGEGEVVLDRVTVEGSLYVRGGGMDSIYLKGCTIARLVIEKGNVHVVLENGSIVTTLQADAGLLKLDNQSGCAIETANLAAAAEITGHGKIAAANISKQGVSIETAPGKTTVDAGVMATIAGKELRGSSASISSGSGGGGGGDSTGAGNSTVYQGHSLENKTVVYGTQLGDLALPASVTITSNKGTAATASVAWDYAEYNPVVAGSYTIKGVLSGATAAWAPAEIAVTVMVQSPLTVVDGTNMAPLLVKSTDTEATAAQKLPGSLRLTLSDDEIVSVFLTWTCQAIYSARPGAENTFIAELSGLPAHVLTPAIHGTVCVAYSDEPEAVSVTLTADQESIQRPTGEIPVKVKLSSVVKDQFGDDMAAEGDYRLAEAYAGVSLAREGAEPAVTITRDAAASAVIATMTAGSASDSAAIAINGEPRRAAALDWTDFVTTMTLRTKGNTMTYSFTAVAQDQHGAVMRGETVTFALEEEVIGVTIGEEGLITIWDHAVNGSSFTVLASCGTLEPLEKTVTISKAASQVSRVEVSGDTSITTPDPGPEAFSYTATLYDQYGVEMTAVEGVRWSIENAPIPGVEIAADSGVVTVRDTAREGTSVTIQATIEGTMGALEITLTADSSKAPKPSVSLRVEQGVLSAAIDPYSRMEDITSIQVIFMADNEFGDPAFAFHVTDAGLAAASYTLPLMGDHTRNFVISDYEGDIFIRAAAWVDVEKQEESGISSSGEVNIATIDFAMDRTNVISVSTIHQADDTYTVTTDKALEAGGQYVLLQRWKTTAAGGYSGAAAYCFVPEVEGSAITLTVEGFADPEGKKIAPLYYLYRVMVTELPDGAADYRMVCSALGAGAEVMPIIQPVPVATGLGYQWDSALGLLQTWTLPEDVTNITGLRSIQTQDLDGEQETSSTDLDQATDLLAANAALPRTGAELSFSVTSLAGEGHADAVSQTSAAITLECAAAIDSFAGAVISEGGAPGTYEITVTSGTPLPQGIYLLDGADGANTFQLDQAAVVDDATTQLTFSAVQHGELTGVTVSRVYNKTLDNAAGAGTVCITAPQAAPIAVTGALTGPAVSQVSGFRFRTDTGPMEFTWTPPDELEGISHYRIEMKEENGSWFTVGTAASADDFITAAQLYLGSAGSFQVRITSMGEEGYTNSDPVMLEKPYILLSQETGLGITANYDSDGQLTLHATETLVWLDEFTEYLIVVYDRQGEIYRKVSVMVMNGSSTIIEALYGIESGFTVTLQYAYAEMTDSDVQVQSSAAQTEPVPITME